jgi:predicted nucleotidyltransferase
MNSTPLLVPQTDLQRRLSANRDAVVAAAARAGVRNVRVFGSVARGDDTESSDIDLLVEIPRELGLFELGRLETEMTEILGVPVDLVPDRSLRATVRSNALDEAVAL